MICSNRMNNTPTHQKICMLIIAVNDTFLNNDKKYIIQQILKHNKYLHF